MCKYFSVLLLLLLLFLLLFYYFIIIIIVIELSAVLIHFEAHMTGIIKDGGMGGGERRSL